MANDFFFPPVEPFATGTLTVDPPHVLYWEQVGTPDGIPILFVHGGPGAGCSAFDRRFFDPTRFRVVLVDQRGSGRSRPHGDLSGNDADHLVADFEALRRKLGIERWHLFGGSWGSTLALHYAETHPERVLTMVLRGIWLMRDEDIGWWLYDIGKVQPELWAAFAGLVPEEERGDLMEAYWRRLTGDDREAALAAARAWSVYEGSACTLLPNPEFADMFEDPGMAWSLARLEAHFMRNVRLRPDGILLDRVDRIRHIPALAVHGRYDIVCPAKNLHDLKTAWPELDAVFVPDAGHSSHEPGITRELVAATQRIAGTGSPVRPRGDATPARTATGAATASGAASGRGEPVTAAGPFLPHEVRAQFPGAAEKVYFDVALRGLIPRVAAEAAHAHVEEVLNARANKAAHLASVEHCREMLAGLVGAHADEVAITKNVSEGLNLFASSLSWQAGDNVVLCPELEHPNNVFLWYNLRKLKGIEVRAVEPDAGRISVEGFAAAVDERTRLVTVPHVSFSPGFVTDVRAVSEVAHGAGALLLVDAAQSIGSLRCDVRALGIDALAVAAQKSLVAFYGIGFLFVRKALAESLIPAHVARYGMDMGAEAGETARTGGEHLPYAAGARRFDLGNYNYLGAQAAEASLALITSLGMDRVETHLRALSARLVDGLLALGLPVAGGPPGPHLGHIVAVGHSGGGHHDTADDPAMNDLHRHLTANGVKLSIRKGVLRMSLGLYNDVSDVDRFLTLVREWVEARGSAV